ncbi:MAG: NlpC/P60 family protein [Conexibacter sp.]|nr:NlpC/P60 family protein [Conexibacter sp.]
MSYALIGAGMLASPMVSGTLAHWAAHGDGRWLSIYANKGHVYLEVAGLRLDTSAVGDGTRLDGVRWRPVIGRRTGFSARHPLGL